MSTVRPSSDRSVTRLLEEQMADRTDRLKFTTETRLAAQRARIQETLLRPLTPDVSSLLDIHA